MADFNALETLINAYIKKNGVQAITGNILNGVLRGMVSALGKGYTIVGVATPSTDPGTLTGPCAYYASTYGTYTNFGNIVVNDGEIAMLIYDEQTWHKEKMWRLDAEASIDANVGTPSVETSFEDEVLTFRFHNIKGNPGDAAGFGTVNASVDSNIGTPGVSVQTSGPDTAKNMTFQFTNLKGETGVTSVVCTVDNTIGTPSCAVSLVGQELHLDFSGLKGNKGDTGVSADYPITIYNGLDSTATDQALSAYQGKVLNDEISQLDLQVHNLSGKFYGVFEDAGDLPDGDSVGYAFVGNTDPFDLFVFDGSVWVHTDAQVKALVGPQGPQGEPGEQGIQGETGPAGVTTAEVFVDNNTGIPSASAVVNNGILTIQLHNIKGEQGNSGYQGAANELEIVNNCTDGGATKGLSAQMGKELQDQIDGLVKPATADLDISDENGSVLARFSGGDFRVKNFDSSKTPQEKDITPDFAIVDENDKAIAIFSDGHIKTKNFDSREVGVSWLRGKKLSIMGDSISTASDNNAVQFTVLASDIDNNRTLQGYPTYYDIGKTIGGVTVTSGMVGVLTSFTPVLGDAGKTIGQPLNYNTQSNSGVKDQKDTWWYKMAEALGMEVLQNVSWSGASICSHEGNTDVYKTSYAWHPAQIAKLATRNADGNAVKPDVVVIYRGTNDMSHSPFASLTDFGADAMEIPASDYENSSYDFKVGYCKTIQAIREAYPGARIFVCTLNIFKRNYYSHFPTNNGINTLPEYNNAIREVANMMGCGLIEFDKDGITFENCYPTYISDSSTEPTHPNPTGHTAMAEKAVIDIKK